VTHVVITFRNEETGEFSFYEVKFSASPPGKQGSLALECPVRVAANTRVTVRNPLPTAVTLKGSASHKLLRVPPTITVEPGAAAQVAVSFRPLLVGSETATLKLECAELGLFEWDVKLAGLPTNPEKALSFNVPLGGREAKTYRFTHWLEDKADYKVSYYPWQGGLTASGCACWGTQWDTGVAQH
jgi:hydrocephalus-inducing protein